MRILIVDDQPVMRGGIRMSLQGFDTATETIEAADLEEAVQAAKGQGPFELVLLDLKLPAVSGVETLLAFRKAVDPSPPVVNGRSVKEIARGLGISPATVKAHVQPILRALDVVNRTEAIVALHRLGFSLETDPDHSG